MFRGATPEIFERFITDGYEYHTLDINYRSKQEIIDNAGVELKCDRGVGGEIIKNTNILRYGPQILCRTNKEVEQIKKLYPSVMTVHGAKGLEFNNVCVINFTIESEEDANIMFVALTRAKDRIAILKFAEVLNYFVENSQDL
jgi:superfamily I DNA/RNA helicase